MVDDKGNFSVVFGGTDFAVPPNLLRVWIPTLTEVISSRPLPSIPADFTLVRELFAPDIYVVYGGACRSRYLTCPHSPASASVRVKSEFCLQEHRQTRQMPIDGTLLREQTNPRIYLVENQKLRWVTSPAAMNGRCLPWRHVRIVADNQLAGLARRTGSRPTLRLVP